MVCTTMKNRYVVEINDEYISNDSVKIDFTPDINDAKLFVTYQGAKRSFKRMIAKWDPLVDECNIIHVQYRYEICLDLK